MTQPIQLMIVGAPKAGSTSMAHYLAQHPHIYTHNQLDMHYFIDEAEYQAGYEQSYKKYFEPNRFPNGLPLGKLALLMYWPKAIKRLYDHNPDIRVIVVLRQPISRAYSAYWYNYRHGWEPESFEKALGLEEKRIAPYIKDGYQISRPDKGQLNTYKFRGIYYKPIEFLFEQFGKNQVHIVLLEDLKNESAQAFQRIFDAANLQDFTPNMEKKHNPAKAPRSRPLARGLAWLFRPQNPVKKAIKSIIPDNVSSKIRQGILEINSEKFTPPPMNPQTRQMLVEYFKPHNEKLAELINRDLSHWNR